MKSLISITIVLFWKRITRMKSRTSVSISVFSKGLKMLTLLWIGPFNFWWQPNQYCSSCDKDTVRLSTDWPVTRENLISCESFFRKFLTCQRNNSCCKLISTLNFTLLIFLYYDVCSVLKCNFWLYLSNLILILFIIEWTTDTDVVI